MKPAKNHDMWQCPNCRTFQWDLPQEGLKRGYLLCCYDYALCGRVLKRSDVKVWIPKEEWGIVNDHGKLTPYEDWIKCQH